MKGNFDDDDRISNKDAWKKTTFGSNSGIFLINYPAFVNICLFINRGESRTGRNEKKEKGEKTQKKQLKLLHERKIFLIGKNISSTETLQYCSRSSSANMVAVNIRPDYWYVLLNISSTSKLFFV